MVSSFSWILAGAAKQMKKLLSIKVESSTILFYFKGFVATGGNLKLSA